MYSLRVKFKKKLKTKTLELIKIDAGDAHHRPCLVEETISNLYSPDAVGEFEVLIARTFYMSHMRAILI